MRKRTSERAEKKKKNRGHVIGALFMSQGPYYF